MATTRFQPLGNVEETHASHEVMELVRGNSVLSLLVVQLRESGKSWRGVKAAIEAEITRRDSQADRKAS
jgi:hypothetical protein